jgi:hypothetical protein
MSCAEVARHTVAEQSSFVAMTFALGLAFESYNLHTNIAVLEHKPLSMVQRYVRLSEGHTRSVLERMTEPFSHDEGAAYDVFILPGIGIHSIW